MTTATIISATVVGIRAERVLVHAEVARRFQQPPATFVVEGLPEVATREVRVRVKSAIENSGYKWPHHDNVVVRVEPVDLRKDSTSFDLPVALAILAASGQMSIHHRMRHLLVVGELSLDGTVRHVRGALPLALHALETECSAIVVSDDNVHEAQLVVGLPVVRIQTLSEAVDFYSVGTDNPDVLLKGEVAIKIDPALLTPPAYPFDLADVCGQERAKRALEIAAAGGHSTLMVGPPGSGKTMLAKRLLTIMPAMTLDEALEVTKVYSVSGLTNGRGLVAHRPFRAPHHTISDVGMVGGGTGTPRPGEVSLAHNGVLFLDELPEFRKNALERLEEPLKEGKVSITPYVGSRPQNPVAYPSKALLVAGMNPCPCGYDGDPRHVCQCTPERIREFKARTQHRDFDIRVEVPAVAYRELREVTRGEPSEVVRARVEKARAFARTRPVMSKSKPLSDTSEEELDRLIDKLKMSSKEVRATVRIARTIADLAGSLAIEPEHVTEASTFVMP